LALIQGSAALTLATIEGFVYYFQLTWVVNGVRMKDFTYAIIAVLGAIVVVVGIDAYLFFTGHLIH
jgi:hypothetical protein